MRIEELRIVGYQVLQDIIIYPGKVLRASNTSQTQNFIDLLVGVNGTGKSTLLRAIAIIFQCLELETIPPFGFTIKYFLDEPATEVFISNLDRDTDKPTDLLRFYQGSNAEDEQEVRVISKEFLPRHIIALTSGSETDWIYNPPRVNNDDSEQLPLDSDSYNGDLEQFLQDWDLTEIPGKTLEINHAQIRPNPSSRFLLMTADLIPYIVLSGLLCDMCNGKKALQQVLEAAKIQEFYGFSLQLYLNTDQIRADFIPFITKLWDGATYIVQTPPNYLLVFLFDSPKNETSVSSESEGHTESSRPEQLLGETGDGLTFLTQMLPLIIIDESGVQIIRKVNLFLKSGRSLPRTSAEEISSSVYLFDWLSDGEKSLLGRLCLLPLLSYTEALVLLDEPEVHFNDYWKRQLVQILNHSLQQQRQGQHPTASHVIMTTHSSITLSDVANTNIWLLERDYDNQSRATQPHLRTLGTDPSDIIVHIFRADSAVGAFSAAYIREQLVASEKKSPKERLEMLNELLDRVGPGYWRYLIRREILSLEAPQLWNSLTPEGETLQ